ncbi:MAG: hypothetical protein AB8B88_02090 [Devosiaceae bacterium]
MLETIAALALCVQVSDYVAFHLSYDPAEQANSDAIYGQSEEWAVELRGQVADADAFVIALHDADQIAYGLSGERLMAEFDLCNAGEEGVEAPDGKG